MKWMNMKLWKEKFVGWKRRRVFVELHLGNGRTPEKIRKFLNSTKQLNWCGHLLRMAFPEDGWPGRGQGNFLSFEWETILRDGWTPSWPTTLRHGKTGILSHYYFPSKNLKYYIKKEEDKRKHSNWTLLCHPLPLVWTC